MTTLPKEIEEEIVTKFTVEYKYVVDNRDRFSDMEDFLRDALNEVYTTARRQALTEGIASLPIKNHVDEGDNVTHAKDEYWGCCECYTDDYMNKYRTEAIAKLTQLRDV